jgi:hypothetical protein
VTSTIKMLRSDDVWHPRVGAPLGNRNRLKTGYHARECKEMRRRIAQWRRETRALLARAQLELAMREFAQTVAKMNLPSPPRERGRGARGEGISS